MRSGVWERLEREYREKRRRDDEVRKERRRQELTDDRDLERAVERAKRYAAEMSVEELLEEAGKRWGVDFCGGAQPRAAVPHNPGGVKVEVVEAGEMAARGRAAHRESVSDVALRIIFHLKNETTAS